MITISRQQFLEKDVKRCYNLLNIFVKILVSGKAISFIIIGLRSFINRIKFKNILFSSVFPYRLA